MVIVPTQNPDGREAYTRRNDYGFDINRDWFARTQPETDGKIELMRKYPPQLFIDAHEMGGTEYFFPPNADPIYHEIAEQDDRLDQPHRRGERGGFATTAPAGARSRRSATSTASPTTCSTWATATRCRRPGSARRA